MKLLRRLIPSLLVLFVLLSGCAGSDNSDIRKAINTELGLLKKLDSDSVSGYISGTGLLTDALPEDSKSSSEIQDAFSLFFRDFDYKIQSVDIDPSGQTASASVRLTTLDAKNLARDYKAASLTTEIEKAASSPGASGVLSSAERYHLLYDLLSSTQYETRQNTIDLSLSQNNGAWEINRTESLEDALSGGLITYLSDASLLSPSETLDVYLRSLKQMDETQMQNYLGVDSLVESGEESRKTIAEAMIRQVQQHYNYKITDTSWEGAKAIVTARITTFDGKAIMDSYRADMDEYLASAQAVIDGAEKRTAIAQEKLLAYISDNTATATADALFEMENDGTAWRLISPGEDLGNALFGSLSEEGN